MCCPASGWTADLLQSGKLVVCRGCEDTIREFSLYQWDERSPGRDVPKKRDDHAMDDIRYFAMAVSRPEDPFAAVSVARTRL
jgi:phage terminase large subunit